MNHVNQVTLHGTIVSLAYRSAVLRTKRVIVKGKQSVKNQPGPAPHSCNDGQSAQKQPTDDVLVILPPDHCNKIGDTIWLYGHYASRRMPDGSLATYIQGEYITTERSKQTDTRTSANTVTVRGYIAKLAAPRTTRTGYTIQDALIATATPAGDEAYLPMAVFSPGKYPTLSANGPVTAIGRLQVRQYTNSAGQTGYAWELVPWWISNAAHEPADRYRLTSVEHWLRTDVTTRLEQDTTAEDAAEDMDYWLTHNVFDSPLDDEE